MRARTERGLAALGLTPPPDAGEKLASYGGMLLEQNKVMNLTAITDPDQVVDLHFLDSAALLGAADFKGKSVIDVGTGAGFPGLVLRLTEPTIHLTLLDSLGKRVTWLEQVCRALGAEDVACIHARAEEQALLPGYRDSFDLAVSRAVAPLNLLCELCLPFVRPGGLFLAMKAAGCAEETDEAARCIAKLGGRLRPGYDYAIPGTDITRRVVIVEKLAPTPKGYPRRWAKIQKSPL